MSPEAVASVITAGASALLAITVPWSLRRNATDARMRFYAELDRTYFDIQTLVIERPYLSNPDFCVGDYSIQYDRFAFIIWNFIESISDYGKQDKNILETWRCIADHEKSIHLNRFLTGTNSARFKREFVESVLEDIKRGHESQCAAR